MRERLEKSARGRRRESHSGPAKQAHGEQAAEQWPQRGLAALGVAEGNLARRPRVTAEKAALAGWLRERTTVSLRWVSGRLHMGHYTNASGGALKMSRGAPGPYRKAKATLELMDAKETTK